MDMGRLGTALADWAVNGGRLTAVSVTIQLIDLVGFTSVRPTGLYKTPQVDFKHEPALKYVDTAVNGQPSAVILEFRLFAGPDRITPN